MEPLSVPLKENTEEQSLFSDDLCFLLVWFCENSEKDLNKSV